MAEFQNPPSWLTTARFMGHVLVPGKVSAKGFPPLNMSERRAMATALAVLKSVIGALLVVIVIMTGMIMTVSFFGALIVLVTALVCGPVGIITLIWLGLKIIVEEGQG